MSNTSLNTFKSSVNPSQAKPAATSHVGILLQAIGTSIGLERLVFAKNGFCDLTVNGNHPLSIVRDEAGNRIALMGTLANDFSIVSDRVLLQELLVAAMGPIGGGDGIGMAPDSSTFILYRMFDANKLDGKSFTEEFSGFVLRYMKWLDRVKDGASANGDSAAAATQFA